MLNAASIFGRVLPGFISDYTGVFNVQTVFIFALSLCILVMWTLSTTHAAIIALAILLGFFSGAFVNLLIPAIAKIGPLERLGSRSLVRLYFETDV